jgi:hypothetical protein
MDDRLVPALAGSSMQCGHVFGLLQRRCCMTEVHVHDVLAGATDWRVCVRWQTRALHTVINLSVLNPHAQALHP